MRALLVEDEQGLGSTLKAGLTVEGFLVDWYRDGDTGLWAGLGNPYDVIVLDIMVPGVHGYRVLERLRARGVETPVLMLSGKDGEWDQSDAFELGADGYLVKPVALSVLAAHLRSLVRRVVPRRPEALLVGSLRLDPATCLVHRGDRSITLTPREFDLLAYLMRNTGRVLSKADILLNVWDPAFDGVDGVVEVYVGYVRAKIDAPFGLRTLVNTRGLGYQIVPD